MKITKCDECGYEVSVKTDTCPNCGESIGVRIGGISGLLKRLIYFIMALYIMYSAIKFFGQ